jgi:regulator of protease activity HflC (stomatin/prohibitin superfamily)
MATIKSFPFCRHLRAEPTSHVLFFKAGVKRRAGPGLAFWFLPLGTSIAEVPLDDRDITFFFKARSRDFQEVTVNGVVTWRVTDPELLASRIDFSIDTRTGAFNEDPLDKLALAVNGLCQQLAATALADKPLTALLEDGVAVIREKIHQGLLADPTLGTLGLQIVSTRVSTLSPTSVMEEALQMPTRERIQQAADEATFQRRALAVDKERAIAENELANQIELARREEQLINQRGQNERRRATEAVESKRIEAFGQAQNAKTQAEAQGESIRLVEGARLLAERERMDIYKALPPSVMMGLAARELAGKLSRIEHLNLSPEVLGPLLQRVLAAQAQSLEDGKRSKGA